MKRPYLSYSALKAFAKSPNHYLEYVTGQFEETPAMVLGRAIHALVLEGDDAFADNFAVSPEVDRRTTAGKADWALFLESNDGKSILTPAEYVKAKEVASRVLADPVAKLILGFCPEREIKHTKDMLGYTFTGVADGLGPSTLLDIKTCSDASPDGFARQAHNLHYHLQAALYCRLFNRDAFYWIAAETTPPYNVQVYRQSAAAVNRADYMLQTITERFKAWDGLPCGYADQVLELNLPKWA